MILGLGLGAMLTSREGREVVSHVAVREQHTTLDTAIQWNSNLGRLYVEARVTSPDSLGEVGTNVLFLNNFCLASIVCRTFQSSESYSS